MFTERGEVEDDAAEAAEAGTSSRPAPRGVGAAAPEEQLLSLRWMRCSAAASSSAVKRGGDGDRRAVAASLSAMALDGYPAGVMDGFDRSGAAPAQGMEMEEGLGSG